MKYEVNTRPYREVRDTVNASVAEALLTPRSGEPVDPRVLRRVAYSAARRERDLAIARDQIAKAREEDLDQIAKTDSLTGLHNLRGFDSDLAYSLLLAGELQEPVAIVSLDANGLKGINDTYGHEAGNDYLRLIANILEANSRPTDLVARKSESEEPEHTFRPARWGGDEFGVILWGTDAQGVEAWGERISEVFENTPFEYNGITINDRITIPAGVAIFNPNTNPDITVDALKKQADDNLYRAKTRSKREQKCVLVMDESSTPTAA